MISWWKMFNEKIGHWWARKAVFLFSVGALCWSESWSIRPFLVKLVKFPVPQFLFSDFSANHRTMSATKNKVFVSCFMRLLTSLLPLLNLSSNTYVELTLLNVASSFKVPLVILDLLKLDSTTFNAAWLSDKI